jgi:thiol-disulfide isomerase/thioredoxin
VEDAKWFQHSGTLAWDPRYFVLDSRYPGLESGDGETKDYRQVYFGDMSQGWGREQSGDEPEIYFRRPSIEALWNTSSLMGFKFFGLTPRQFWWGNNSGHNLGHNPVPPSMVDYVHMGEEVFDGEVCDAVESKGRAERLWIGRESGLIRGCMEYIYQGRMDTEFHESPVVERVAGRTFASSKAYREWYQANEKSLPREQYAELTKAFYEAYFDEMAKESSLILFSDHREIAPGVWLPFAEDRTTWHHHESDDTKYKYIRCETRVTKASLHVDLEAQVASLAPKAGARVQDQRFDSAVVEYPWRDDLTAEEIESLVQSKRLEMEGGRRLLEELAAPMVKMVGQAAPVLPDEGWIGERPQLAGKPYLIHFWAAWCGPCKNDYELLNRVAKNRCIIGIHPAGTPQEKVEVAVKEAQLTYPTLVSAESKDELVAGYPVKMYPYCVVVDSKGKIAAHGRLTEVAEAFGDLHE